MTEINCKDNVLHNCDEDLKFSPHVNENPIKILNNEIIFVPVDNGGFVLTIKDLGRFVIVR